MGINSSGISLPNGINIQSTDPIDSRTVFNDKTSALASLLSHLRYQGLKVFIKSENREYWFRDGVEDSDFIPCNSFEDFVYGDDMDEDGKTEVSHNLHSTHIDVDIYDSDNNICLVSYKCVDEDTIQLDFDCPSASLSGKIFKVVCRI